MNYIAVLCKGRDLNNIVKIIVFKKHGIGAVHELGKIYCN